MSPSHPAGIIQQRAFAIREACLANATLAPYIETGLPPTNLIPEPFLGSDDIRLVIIGQDPTVANRRSQLGITTALDLARPGPLRAYVAALCADFGLTLEQVYATNVCKMVFADTPTRLGKQGVDVLTIACDAGDWLGLLADEAAQFPGALVVSLGKPVLSLLVRDSSTRLRDYWGYHPRWKEEPLLRPSVIQRASSTIARMIAPYPHLNSANKAFYRTARPDYSEYVRHQYKNTLQESQVTA